MDEVKNPIGTEIPFAATHDVALLSARHACKKNG